MKRILLFFAALVTVICCTSCQGEDYLAFVGTWGADRIDYYNIDYAGAPIEDSRTTFFFTPGDPENGIDLIFRNDRSGEMRDRSRDTLDVLVYEDGVVVDTTTIYCLDTVVVTKFTYSYHNDDALLYMNMESTFRYYDRTTSGETTEDKLEEVIRRYTYKMHIDLLTDESFIYENEYKPNYVERARLIRISEDAPAKRAPKPVAIPRKPGSLFGNY